MNLGIARIGSLNSRALVCINAGYFDRELGITFSSFRLLLKGDVVKISAKLCLYWFWRCASLSHIGKVRHQWVNLLKSPRGKLGFLHIRGRRLVSGVDKNQAHLNPRLSMLRRRNPYVYKCLACNTSWVDNNEVSFENVLYVFGDGKPEAMKQPLEFMLFRCFDYQGKAIKVIQ